MFQRKLVLLLCVALFSPRIAAQLAKPVLLATGLVYSNPKTDPYDRANFYGFNHAPSVTRLSDGRLLAAWFSGPFEGSVDQVILGCASPDDGRSWRDGMVLNDQPRKSDFDPAFIADGSRTWLFYSVGRWNRYPFVASKAGEKVDVGIESFKLFSRHTDDGGKKWSDEQRIGEQTGWGSRCNGIRLSSGELLLPLHRFEAGYPAAVMKSGDGGKTWRKIDVPKAAEKSANAEPTIAQCASGKVLMVLRSRDGWLWMTDSADKGETWSVPRKSDVPGTSSCSNLLRLSDGRLLLTHNPSKPPIRSPLTTRASADEGKTWGEPLELANVEIPGEDDVVRGRQVTYPSSTLLPDGSALIVWTEICIAPQEQWGKIHWAKVKGD
jgi:predicted neuraminidase